MGKIQLAKRSNRTGVLSSAKSGELKNKNLQNGKDYNFLLKKKVFGLYLQ